MLQAPEKGGGDILRDNEQMNGIWQCKCGSYNIKVVDSRQQEDGSIKRTRLCEDCGHRAYTKEVTKAYLNELQNADRILYHLKALKALIGD